MVGNDVVDLADPETAVEAQNPRFDRRVFSSDELLRLTEADDPKALRWSLWAAKESAFKLAKRDDPATVFAHAEFVTNLDQTGWGSVSYKEWCCAVSVSVSGRVVHAVATPEHGDRQKVVSAVRVIPAKSDPSLLVREFATSSVASHLGVNQARVTIINGPHRIPILRVDGQNQGFLSLSHHGELVAFAWLPVSH